MIGRVMYGSSKNCIESAVILCGQEEIDPADLSLGTIARPVEAAQPAETRQYGTLREETIRFEGQLLRAGAGAVRRRQG